MGDIYAAPPFDGILKAIDPRGVRGTCATGIAAVTAALAAPRPTIGRLPAPLCDQHWFFGGISAGKTLVVEALEKVAEALGVPVLTSWAVSYEAAHEALHETLQRRKVDARGGAYVEQVHSRVLWILQEQRWRLHSRESGCGRRSFAGFARLMREVSDGVLPPRVHGQRWPELRGVTVIWAHVEHSAHEQEMLDLWRELDPSAPKRQAVWTVQRIAPPVDAGRLLAENPVEYWQKLREGYQDCFNTGALYAAAQNVQRTFERQREGA